MSAKKKRNAIAQCQYCQCYYMNVDGEEVTRTRVNARTSRGGQRNSPLSSRLTPLADQKSDEPGTPKTPNTPSTSEEASEPCAHGDVLSQKNFFQCVVPGVGMCALAQSLDKRETFLPSETTGWMRRHVALVNGETLTQLAILPRSPVLVEYLTPESGKYSSMEPIQSDVFVVWPCPEVPQMRVNVNNSLGSTEIKKLRIYTVRPRAVVALKLSLSRDSVSQDFERRLSSQKGDQFTYYLKAYLSNAFLRRDFPIPVDFYTKKLFFQTTEVRFAEKSDLELEMTNLSLSTKNLWVKTEVLSVTFDTHIQLEWGHCDEDECIR